MYNAFPRLQSLSGNVVSQKPPPQKLTAPQPPQSVIPQQPRQIPQNAMPQQRLQSVIIQKPQRIPQNSMTQQRPQSVIIQQPQRIPQIILYPRRPKKEKKTSVFLYISIFSLMVLIGIYIYNQYNKVSDDEALDAMKKGFEEGYEEASKPVINDIIKNFKFIDGSDNWKYSKDTTDQWCVKKWDYYDATGNNIIQADIPILTNLKKDHSWCATKTKTNPLDRLSPDININAFDTETLASFAAGIITISAMEELYKRLTKKAKASLDNLIKAGVKNVDDLIKAGVKNVDDLVELGIKGADDLLKLGIKSSDDLLKLGVKNADDLVKIGIKNIDNLTKMGLNNIDTLIKLGIKTSDDLIKIEIKTADALVKIGMKNTDDLAKLGIKTIDDLLKVGIKTADDLVKIGIKNTDDLAKLGIKTIDDLLKVGIKTTDDLVKISINNIDKLTQFGIKGMDDLSKFGIKTSDDLFKIGIKTSDDLLKFGIKTPDDLFKYGIKNADELAKFGIKNIDILTKFGLTNMNNLLKFGIQNTADFVKIGIKNMDEILKLSSTLTKQVYKRYGKIMISSSLKIRTKLISNIIFSINSASFLKYFKKLPYKSAAVLKHLKSFGKLLGKKLGTSLSKATLKGALKALKPGPMAMFDIISFGLDVGNVGGFSQYETKETLYKTKKYLDESFEKIVFDKLISDFTEDQEKEKQIAKEQGLPFTPVDFSQFTISDFLPLIMDPTNELKSNPDYNKNLETKITTLITDMLNFEESEQPHKCVEKYITTLQKDAESGKLKLTGEETDEQLETIMESYTTLIDYDCIKDIISNDECRSVDGLIYDNNKCTFKKEKCIKTLPIGEDQIYTEFKDGKCILASPGMKEVCNKLKSEVLGGNKNSVTYNEETGMCDISEEYCRTKGVSWKYNSNIKENDCYVPLEQKVFEVIFGDTVTRAFNRFYMPIINVAVDSIKLLVDPPTKMVPATGLITFKDSRYGDMCLAAASNKIPTKVIAKPCNTSDNTQQFVYTGDYNNGKILYMGRQKDNRFRYCLEVPCGRTKTHPQTYSDNLDRPLGINICLENSPIQAFAWSPDNKQVRSLYDNTQLLDYRRRNTMPTLMQQADYRKSDQQFDFSMTEVPDLKATLEMTYKIIAAPFKMMADFASLF